MSFQELLRQYWFEVALVSIGLIGFAASPLMPKEMWAGDMTISTMVFPVAFANFLHNKQRRN